jgi:hypothetical protein
MVDICDNEIEAILQKAKATPRRLDIVDWTIREIAECVASNLVWSGRAAQAVTSGMRTLLEKQLRTRIEHVAETLGLWRRAAGISIN